MTPTTRKRKNAILVITCFGMISPNRYCQILISFLFVAIFGYGVCQAQDSLTTHNSVSLSYGFGYLDDVIHGFWYRDNFESKQSIGPFYLMIETSLNRKVGFAGEVSYVQMHAADSNNTYGYSVFTAYGYTINLRFNYYFVSKFSKVVEPYVAAGLGFRDFIYTCSTDADYLGLKNDEEFHTTGVLVFGSRINIIKHLSMYAEFGLATSSLKIGLSTKF